MTHGNPFILGSEGQVYESQNTAGVCLCTLMSAGFFWLKYNLVFMHYCRVTSGLAPRVPQSRANLA